MNLTYSFIRPKAKSIFKTLTKIWMLCIGLSVLCMAGFYSLLHVQILHKQNELTLLEQNTAKLQLNIIATKDYLNRLNFEQSKIARIIESPQIDSTHSTNKRYRDGFSQLLGLIPAQITLSHLIIQDNYLELHGITPSKEVYIFLLQTPLKASFDESKVEFFPLSNGWFHFISVNRKTNPYLIPKDKDKD